MISQYFEAPVRRAARRRVEPHFDSLFTSRNEVRRLRAQVKNCRKNLSETILGRVARQISCEMRLCQDWRPQNGPQELSRDPCEDSWGPLGCSWAHVEKLSRRSWRSWSTLGALLARSWNVLDVGPYKMLYARFSSFQNRFGIPQELILVTPRMDLGVPNEGFRSPHASV